MVSRPGIEPGTQGFSILVLPFGIIPIIFIIGMALLWSTNEKLEKVIGSRVGTGITEYPLEVSLCLYGIENSNEIAFSDNGKSIILNIKLPTYTKIDSPAEAQSFIKGNVHHGGKDLVEADWVDKYIIQNITKNEEKGTLQIVVTIPDEIVLSEKYIEHEIRNFGRVFKRNSGNLIRWLLYPRYLLYPQCENKITRVDDKLLVYIDRLQIVPGFFDEKEKIMSEKQITRNIKNRLWNRVNVKCISIDETTYCGEILDV